MRSGVARSTWCSRMVLVVIIAIPFDGWGGEARQTLCNVRSPSNVQDNARRDAPSRSSSCWTALLQQLDLRFGEIGRRCG